MNTLLPRDQSPVSLNSTSHPHLHAYRSDKDERSHYSDSEEVLAPAKMARRLRE